jgi:Flp pilus assembly protein TadG
MRRLGLDRRGTSAIEFAIALPVLILLFTGGFQLSDAVAAYRKVTTTSRALADLTSQYTSVNDVTLTRILNASQQVLAPYSTTNATFTISQVSTDALLRTRVDWSAAKNAVPLTKGADFSIPAGMKVAGTSAIVARVTYLYRPAFGGSYIGNVPLGDTIIMLPRGSDSITKE